MNRGPQKGLLDIRGETTEAKSRSTSARTKDRAVRYGIALLVVTAATLLRMAFAPLLGATGVPFILYFPAVVVVSWIGGLGPGILSVLICAVLADYLFVAPAWEFIISRPEQVWSVTAFVITGIGIATIGEAQRRALTRIRERERLIFITLQSIGDGVLVTDREGQVTMMNPVAEKLTGWSIGDARGKDHTDVFRISREGTGEPVESPVDRVLREGMIVGLANHTVLTARDGSVCAIADSGAPVRGDEGEIQGVVLVFRDVTDERQEERRARFLLRLGERTRAHNDVGEVLGEIVQAVGEYMGISRCLYAEVDVEQGSAVIRRDYCLGVPSMAGSRPLTDWGETAEVVKAGENLVIADAQLDPRSAPVYETAYGPLGIRAALTVPLHKDGKLVALIAAHDSQQRRWSVSDIRLLGDVLEDTWLTLENARLYQAAQEEIGERRRAEVERERYLSEVQALNERLRFAMSETHHRVKNNLQVISGLVGMHIIGEGTTVPVDALQQLNQHIRSLAVIHDILTTQARTDGSTQEISITSTLQRLQPILQEMTEGRRIEFEVEECTLPIRQSTTVAVLVNELVSNALKHGEGTITVRFQCQKDIATLSVTDEGKGFPTRFDWQTAAHTGLELVENLAQWDLQGTVQYENAPGGQVRIRFPLPTVTPV